MKTYLLSFLEEYLRKEGLSSFLPASKDKTIFSYTLLLLIILSVAITARAFDRSFWVGLSIPILSMSVYFIVLIFFVFFREIAKLPKDKSKIDPNTFLTQREQRFLSTSIIAVLLFAPSIVLGIYAHSWIAALVLFVVIFVVILFSGIFLFSRDYWIVAIIEIITQFIKGWSVSWQAVLSTTPVLLVTILLSLFSGDMWDILSTMSVLELTLLIVVIYIPLFFAVFANIELSDLILQESIDTEEKLVDRAFSIKFIDKKKNRDLLSVEDRDDVIALLKRRDVGRTKTIVANDLKGRIQAWYILLIFLSSLLLGFGFFAIFYSLFSFISPSLSDMGWLQTPKKLPAFRNAIPQVSFFLASIQVAAFAASLLEKPKGNILFRRTIEKATDWLTAIIVFQTIYSPKLQIWDAREEAPWHKKLGVKTIRGKIIAEANSSDEDVKHGCEKLEELFPRVQLIDFNVYKQHPSLAEKIRFGVEDFQWKYIHNRKLSIKQFDPIPGAIEIHEQHLLGREKYLEEKEIPFEWFGDNKKTANLGKAIWDSDVNHEVIMHPRVFGSGEKVIHISVHLFRRLKKSEEYSLLVHNIFDLAKKVFPNANLFSVDVYHRSSLSSKVIAKLESIEGIVTYQDERQREFKLLNNLMWKYHNWKQKRNK